VKVSRNSSETFLTFAQLQGFISQKIDNFNSSLQQKLLEVRWWHLLKHSDLTGALESPERIISG
jgi:hypothetical protein